MSSKKYDLQELADYASTHYIHDIAEHYNININSAYTLLNINKIDYKKINPRKNKKNVEKTEEYKVAKMYGNVVQLHTIQGFRALAIGVLAYAKIDNDENFPMREMWEAVALDDYM